MTTEAHIEHFKVRNYECDMQGAVNNGVYQNYLEHARHEYLHTLGIDFAALTLAGINLVVVRSELDYRLSLRSGDAFYVVTRMKRESKVRFVFFQEIIRQSDNRLVLSGKIIGTALNERGRPHIPQILEKALAQLSPA